MDPLRRTRVEEICDAALDCDRRDRAVFVANACGDDEALLRDVEALLAYAQMADGFCTPSIGAVAAQVLGEGRVTLLGRLVGPYQILAHIGAGGMGDVYRARDSRLGRDVAIKALLVDLSRDHSQRFRREAHAIASLNHPRICTVHDVGEHDGINYLVMEYLEGPTLKERLQEASPLPVKQAVHIASEIAEALGEAHRHGIVHGDIKPANVKLTKTGAKLLDFGLAQNVETTARLRGATSTFTDGVFGTPSYMSPEQILSKEIDPRSDIFSLGVMIHEMVTGRRPFDGATISETLDATLTRSPEALTTLNPGVPVELERLVAKCLEKTLEDRYESTEALQRDLAEVARACGPPFRAVTVHRRHNLPVQLTSFIGRGRDVAEICSLLECTRLLTLAGPGGCGKTRLGLVVASNVVERFEDGVWFTELAAMSDEEIVPQCVASTLGVRGDEGRSPVQAVLDFLQERHLLLILDNCEHLVGAVARFAERILTSCERVTILATSREALHVMGERIWRVPPLSYPDSASISPQQLSEYEAVRLFVERARRIIPFQLDPENARHVVEICRRLDGMPLAIEMAVSRLDVLSPDQIVARLGDRFRILGGTRRVFATRQETLRTALDWSHDLLDPHEQAMFRRLAVFTGTFDLQAIEVVCSVLADAEHSDVVTILSRLVDKSMVTIHRTNRGVRYGLLETIREYAREKLHGAPDEYVTRNKHLDFFLKYAEELEPELHSHAAAQDGRRPPQCACGTRMVRCVTKPV